MDCSQLKHDFINNSLRLEVLNKLICEALEQNETIDQEILLDCERFLKEQIDYIKEMLKPL